jgi:hypothetical protein
MWLQASEAGIFGAQEPGGTGVRLTALYTTIVHTRNLIMDDSALPVLAPKYYTFQTKRIFLEIRGVVIRGLLGGPRFVPENMLGEVSNEVMRAFKARMPANCPNRDHTGISGQ